MQYFGDLVIYNECIFSRMHKHYEKHILHSKLLYISEYRHRNNKININLKHIMLKEIKVAELNVKNDTNICV